MFSGAVTGAANLADLQTRLRGQRQEIRDQGRQDSRPEVGRLRRLECQGEIDHQESCPESAGAVRLIVDTNTISDSYGRAVDGDGDGKAGRFICGDARQEKAGDRVGICWLRTKARRLLRDGDGIIPAVIPFHRRCRCLRRALRADPERTYPSWAGKTAHRGRGCTSSRAGDGSRSP